MGRKIQTLETLKVFPDFLDFLDITEIQQQTIIRISKYDRKLHIEKALHPTCPPQPSTQRTISITS